MKNLRFVFGLFSLVVMLVLVAVFFTPTAKAGADEKVKIINHIKYYDVGGAYCANLSGTVISYEPVVYNGYGHYYIMGNSGHNNGHGYIITATYVIHTTIQVDSCYT